MVFHDIESITEVISGHRIIIYYIEGIITSELKLSNFVKTAMEMLQKKNDDLIIFKVCQNTPQFNQFKELYRPSISSPIALFVINSEGIPLICEQIDTEDKIFEAFDSICSYCNLNAVPKSEITKVFDYERGKTLVDKSNTEVDLLTNGLQPRPLPESSKIASLSENDFSVMKTRSENNDTEETFQTISTMLQIRLPDGTKEKQQFDKNALLQEVYDFIITKFNLKDFDIKTYNCPVFSAEDYEKTLKDLDLTPNGVVIVVNKNVAPFNNNNGILKMIHLGFWVLFSKTTSFFGYIQGLLYTYYNSFFSSGPNNQRQIQNQSQANRSSGQRSASNGVKRSTTTFGNIHTLRRSDDSDDENNRYNGNSTQQK